MLIKNTKKFQDYLSKGKKLQEGSPLKEFGVSPEWVVREMSIREGTGYLQNASYCHLGKSEGRILIGFVVADKVPFGCRAATDEECLQIDEYRKAHHIYPFPLRVVPQKLSI